MEGSFRKERPFSFLLGKTPIVAKDRPVFHAGDMGRGQGGDSADGGSGCAWRGVFGRLHNPAWRGTVHASPRRAMQEDYRLATLPIIANLALVAGSAFADISSPAPSPGPAPGRDNARRPDRAEPEPKVSGRPRRYPT